MNNDSQLNGIVDDDQCCLIDKVSKWFQITGAGHVPLVECMPTAKAGYWLGRPSILLTSSCSFGGITCRNRFAQESHNQDEACKRVWSESHTTPLGAETDRRPESTRSV